MSHNLSISSVHYSELLKSLCVSVIIYLFPMDQHGYR